MRICSFNVNGIRARPHQLLALRDLYDPDIIGLQEIKVADAEFPLEQVESLGYQVSHYGQKGHYGVALLSKQKPLEIIKGLPSDDADAQKRMILGRFKMPDGQLLHVLNGYFPQGEARDHETKFAHKQRFYAELTQWLKDDFKPTDNILLMGDMNIAPLDVDIGIGEENARRWLRSGKCAFLPEEREWMATLLDFGLTDCFRARYPEVNDRFSWFDYRSKGFEDNPRRGLRIDLLLATQPVLERVKEAGIAYDIRALEKPSDHCPVWVELD